MQEIKKSQKSKQLKVKPLNSQKKEISLNTQTDEFKWDPWQLQIIEHEGNVTARCGRQTGKSTAFGKRRADLMLKYVGSISLVIAPAERQSSGLFDKTLGWLEKKNLEVLKKAPEFKADPKLSAKRNLEIRRKWEYDYGIYNELPTKTSIVLKKNFKKPQSRDNKGSVYYCFPAGRTGVFLRFLSLDFLDIDEAAFVPEMVYNTLKPMLAVSQKLRGLGWESLISTPYGKGGFFYESHSSDDYLKIHISAEDCPRYDRAFLAKERRRVGKIEYAQEYLADFIDELNQFFPTALIKKCMNFGPGWNLKEDAITSMFYAGTDFAGYGIDDNTLVVSELIKNRVKICKCFEFEPIERGTEYNTLTTDTINNIEVIDHTYQFRRLFTDDGGLGSPITDMLKEKLGRRKVMELGNARKRIEVEGEEKKKGILKEDLYSNALMLMECGLIDIIDDVNLLASLKSVMREYRIDNNGKKHLSIWGKNTHLAEAFVRACWCIKEKGLNLYVY